MFMAGEKVSFVAFRGIEDTAVFSEMLQVQ
jgi:hypothetical protein